MIRASNRAGLAGIEVGEGERDAKEVELSRLIPLVMVGREWREGCERECGKGGEKAREADPVRLPGSWLRQVGV